MANVRDGYIVPPLQLEDVPMDSEDRSGPANEMPKYVTSGTLKERPCKRVINYCQSILEFFGRHKVTVLTTFAFIAICALFLAFMFRIWIISDDIGNHHHQRVASKVLLENKQNQLKEQTSTKKELSNGIKPRPPSDADLKLPDDLLSRYENLYKYFSQGDSTRFKRENDDEKKSVCRRKSQDCKVKLDKVRRILAVVDYNVNELRNMLPLFPDSAYIADCLECKRFEADSSSDISDDTPEVDNKSRKVDGIHNLSQLDAFFIKDQISYTTTQRSSVDPILAQQVESNGYGEETTVVQFQQVSYANGNSEDSSTTGQTVEAGSSETSPVTGIRQNTDFESSGTIDNQEISRDTTDKKIVENDPVIENSTTTRNFSEASAILDSGIGENPISAQQDQRDSFAAESHIGESNAEPAGARISDGFSESELRIMANPNAPAVGPTGEFMTTGQQLHYAPSMVPMCFYGLPFTSHGRSGNIDLPMTLPDDQQSMQRVPIPYQSNPVPIVPQRVGPTGPGVQSPRQPYFCTYVPTPNFQFPAVPSAPLYQRNAAEASTAGGEGAPRGARGRLDSIFQDYSTACEHDARLCADGSRCVKKVRWCDGHVDCPDASDEATCSCRNRINVKRVCDGYFDCPHGEDELRCFGCGRHHFSCDDRNTRYPKKNCIPLSQRCDGVKNCQNGKDETDCATLSQTLGDNKSLGMFPVGHIKGYLHKNWKGQWYPVCTPLMNWAVQACYSEIGPEVRQRPLVQFDHSPKNLYDGQYLVENAAGKISAVPNCFGKAVYVQCPPMPCGTRLMLEGNAGPAFDDTFDDHFMEGSRISDGPANGTMSVQNGSSLAEDIPLATERSVDDRVNVTDSGVGNDTIVNAESRVVGGRNSESTAWPFLVAIYRDGLFHCGGAILDEYWILSAAHCVDNFQDHYFEVQAGVLRLVSYSPTFQIRQVKYVVTYEGYEWVNRMGDIAVIRLDEPLHFNRWVRPVCLPEDMTAGLSWRYSPLPEAKCVTMGWGSALEQRVNPDNMREMPVTILPFCKHQIDHNDDKFCAESQSSRDRCQGNSGGTLMCRNPEYPSNWYIAGIVSHGDGCRRPDEPTVYTKVSSFADWIRQVIDNPPITSFARRPLRKCPGFRCEGGFSRCLPSSKRCNGIVDCLDAEDELHCFGLRDQNDFYKQHGSGIDVNNSSDQSNFEEYQEDSPFGDAILTRTGGDRPEEANSDKSQEMHHDSTSTNPSSESITETNMQTSTMPAVSELPENITESAVKNKTSLAKSSVSRFFTCTMLIQNIPIKKRCDNNVDCEDGSDEMGCTCKDYLKNVNPTAICDGHTDCRDNSDEENCDTCNENQFHCRRSGQCISMSQRCDRHIDCALDEDEDDCFTLTNGEYVNMDLDDRPHLNSEGVITWYVNGQWRPACYRKDAGEVDKLGEYMCNYFGFGGLAVIDGTPVQDKPLELKSSSGREVLPYEYPSHYVEQQANNGTCAGFYIRCIPGIVSGANAHLVDTRKLENRTYLWPWHAAIFVDGWYRCSAALLDHQWLLTNSHCTLDIDVTRNYTAAMLGMSRSYFYVDGPHQQLAQVDAIRRVMPADAVLLHLRYPVNFTRHVQPLFYQKKTYAPSKDDPCVAVGVDEGPHTKSVFLQPVLDNCASCYRCFKRVQQEEKCNENGTHNMWSGTIACRSKSGAWYPAAVYHEPSGSCGFTDVVTFTSINCIEQLFLRVMDQPINSSENPPCDGFRCSLGTCISENKVCDGVPDCRDGTDEDPERCRLIKENCDNGVIQVSNCKCGRSEIRCKNGQCIPKQAFCDGHQDCSDGTDEPSNCSCAAYLKLAAPSRICDGSRDCLDKSDEDPKVCSCKESSFECPATDKRDASCVPQDYVCDGVADCPGGYDEKRCRKIKGASEDSHGTGEVQKRSYGMWHSECFPEEATSSKMVADLCRTLGYTSGTIAENATSRIDPATVPRLALFYMVRLNDRCWVKMKGDGPMVTAVPAEDACNRLFVNCL